MKNKTHQILYNDKAKIKYPKKNKAGKDLQHNMKSVTPHSPAPEEVMNFEIFYQDAGGPVTETDFDPPLELEIDLSEEGYEYLFIYKDDLTELEKIHISMLDISEEFTYSSNKARIVRSYVTLEFSKLPDPNVGWGPS